MTEKNYHFEVEGKEFVVEYDGSFCLYYMSHEEDDEFSPFEYDDEIKVMLRGEPMTQKAVFQIYREVKRFITNTIAQYQPGSFHFSANEESKFSLYNRFAKKLALDNGYYLCQDGLDFYFYKEI